MYGVIKDEYNKKNSIYEEIKQNGEDYRVEFQ